MGPDAFDYDLPPERIAQHPAAHRGEARMMIVRETDLVHARVDALSTWLPPRALVVVNASAVVPARTVLRRADGRTFELLWTAPAPGQGPGTHVGAWVRGGKRLQAGDELAIEGLVVRCIDVPGGRERRFEVVRGDVLEACRAAGEVPLPPYIERPTGPAAIDAERYQTVYADKPGSIAAPTAGLHFDEAMLASIDVARLRLHVGPGTFSPMDVTDIRDHRVGPERIEIDATDAAAIEDARAAGRPIVAVGTTVVRALESIASRGRVTACDTSTELVITPGHTFEVVTHLLTNFHLPRSSLLMLVCSFAGRERVLDAYRTAVAEAYRFYSYGDCMLVARTT